MNDDVFNGLGVVITLPSDDSFLKVKETLTRMGIMSKRDKKLYQSCHILHKRGQYAILHFKEMFILDGKNSTFDDDDRQRRNTIVNLLREWGLVDVEGQEDELNHGSAVSALKILPYRDKGEWELVPKYNIGRR